MLDHKKKIKHRPSTPSPEEMPFVIDPLIEEDPNLMGPLEIRDKTSELDAYRWQGIHWLFVLIMAFLVLFIIGYVLVLSNRSNSLQGHIRSSHR